MPRHCIEKDCTIRAGFHYKGNTNPLYCKKHKKENMINIANPICIKEKCKLRPSFNYIGETKAIYCKHHKLDNMIDVIHKKCKIESCIKIPSFNYSSKNFGLYCKEHKLKDMIDVVHDICLSMNCNIQASYNYRNKLKRLYCFKHKLNNMIDINNRNKLCLKCQLWMGSKNNEYLCSDCFRFQYPDHKKFTKYKQKEKFICNKFQEDYPDLNIEFDKQISCQNCNKRRPDIFLDLAHYSIIIEIDENQHREYSCENKRMMEIFESLGNRPLILLRFNPDKYCRDNKTIKSVFQFSKIGTIKETKEFYNRYEELKQRFEYWLKRKPDKEITIEHLFYSIF